MLLVLALATAFMLATTPVASALPSVPELPVAPELSTDGLTEPAALPNVAPSAGTAALATVAQEPSGRTRVFVRGETLAAARRAVLRNGLIPLHNFDEVATIAAVGTPEQIRRVGRAAGVVGVEADRPWALHLDTSHIATRGEAARTFFQPGFPAEIDGRGVSIAVIDGGVDGTHPFFQRPNGESKVRRNLKALCTDAVETFADLLLGIEVCRGIAGNGFIDIPTNDTDTLNLGGHGTHVAGIAAGVDVTLPDGTEIHGAAPGADVIALGVGSVGLSTYASTLALDWVLDNHENPCGDGSCPPIRVVNLSLGPVGGGEYSPDALAALIQDQLVAEGVVVVWSAGNGDELNDGGDGSDNRTNPNGASPTPGILMVANYFDQNTGTRDAALDPSSSRGDSTRPQTWPDVSAPGTDIHSSCRAHLPLCAGAGDYGSMTGTSMAAPHVAGIVATLLQVNPGLTPAQIEDLLEDNAYKFGIGYSADPSNPDDSGSFDKGHGLVDAAAAVAELLGVSPPLPPPPPVSTCEPTDPVVEDPAFDATQLLGTTSPLPSEDALDVLEGRVVEVGSDLEFRITVTDLTDQPPSLSFGEYFDFVFKLNGVEYYATAQRDQLSGEFYELGKFAPTRTHVADLTGSFDNETDTITIRVPPTAFEGRSFFGPGDVLTDISITSRRVLILVVPDADSAPGQCPYTVGYGSIPPPPGVEPPVQPAPGPDGTVAAGQPHSWSGEQTTGVDTLLFGTVSVMGEMDQDELIEVVGNGTLSVTYTGSPLSYVGLEILTTDGQELAYTEIPLGQETTLTAPVTAGQYVVRVHHYVAVATTFQATAQLI